LQGFYNP